MAIPSNRSQRADSAHARPVPYSKLSGVSGDEIPQAASPASEPSPTSSAQLVRTRLTAYIFATTPFGSGEKPPPIGNEVRCGASGVDFRGRTNGRIFLTSILCGYLMGTFEYGLQTRSLIGRELFYETFFVHNPFSSF